ncbi:MAG: erythromycin esterase family protein, partial [Acidobacteria bacterium]|nr:erythromycin esterase family protein [Acidobacteriota bacterium]
LTDATPAGWLANHAYRLNTTSPGAPNGDLEGLRRIVGNASVVGLGEGTHGTHELQEMKLRMIEYLVREMGFTAVVMEAPFPDWMRLNEYALGGDGDPRQILVQNRQLGYFFWANEEIVDLVNWMRAYNATRGNKPPVQIAGMDVFDLGGARTVLTQYVERVDPAKAGGMRATFTLCPPQPGSGNPALCESQTEAIRADLETREAELVAKSSQRDYNYALHAATLIAGDFKVQGGILAVRDRMMADYAQLLRARQSNGKLIVWAHQEHLSKTDRQVDPAKSTGQYLAERLGEDFVAIGNATAAGTFNTASSKADAIVVGPKALPPIDDGSYETSFRSAAIPLMLVPFRHVALPDWLTTQRRLHGGTAVGPYDYVEDLTKKFDAVLYVEQTTPTHSIW